MTAIYDKSGKISGRRVKKFLYRYISSAKNRGRKSFILSPVPILMVSQIGSKNCTRRAMTIIMMMESIKSHPRSSRPYSQRAIEQGQPTRGGGTQAFRAAKELRLDPHRTVQLHQI